MVVVLWQYRSLIYQQLSAINNVSQLCDITKNVFTYGLCLLCRQCHIAERDFQMHYLKSEMELNIVP